MLFQWFLDLLFPPRCVQCHKIGTWLCSYCRKNFDQHLSYETTYYPLAHIDQTIIACRDTSHTIARFLYAWKYRRWLAAGEILQRLIAQTFFRSIQTTESIVCVPIPLHKERLRTRGFNQADKLLDELRSWSVSALPLLIRKKATITQVGLSKVNRQQNLKDAFILDVVLSEHLNKNETIVLIDDVVTSGTTLSECARVLRQHGFHHIVALVLHRGT